MTISATAPYRFVVLLTSVVVALLLLLTGALAFSGVANAGEGPIGTRATNAVVVTHVDHQVGPGDTLWSIASGYTLPGEDVRVTIHEIKSASGLDSSNILVGQVLTIPVDF